MKKTIYDDGDDGDEDDDDDGEGDHESEDEDGEEEDDGDGDEDEDEVADEQIIYMLHQIIYSCNIDVETYDSIRTQ
ncbi:hypothetical protein Tco_1321781, partial [Tanacetum coccineum]